jgi:hypothetical protein
MLEEERFKQTGRVLLRIKRSAVYELQTSVLSRHSHALYGKFSL